MYDLSTIRLPGGTELDALADGFSRLRVKKEGHHEGYNKAARLANTNTLLDATAQQPWILADTKTGLLRSQNAPQLFAGPYKADMEAIFTPTRAPTAITQEQFSKGHAWKRELNIARNVPLTGPLSDIGQLYVRLGDDVLLHHRPAMPTRVIRPSNTMLRYYPEKKH